jgi:hypothetical protein
MPQQALMRMRPDHILPTDEIPGFIRDWGYR